MTKVNEQIMGVMKVIYDTSKLNPKNKLFLLYIGKLVKYPDADAILNKLEKEYEVIKIEGLPNEKRINNDEFGGYRAMWGQKALEDLQSYRIKILPSFEKFYHSEYLKSKISIANLNIRNYLLISDLVKAIDNIVNITDTDKVTLEPDSSGSISKVTLDFLKKVGAIKGYETTYQKLWDDYNETEYDSGEVGYFEIRVSRPEFDEAREELFSMSKRYDSNDKHSPKEGKSKKKDKTKTELQFKDFNYDDEHGIVSYDNKQKKLFEPNTLEGFLLYKVCRADGARINSTDVANDYEAKHPELDKEIFTKTLNNTKNRINEKLNKAFKIKDSVQYGREQFWLNSKYCSETSPYKSARSG